VQHPYYQSILLIERLHRQFLELVTRPDARAFEADRRDLRTDHRITGFERREGALEQFDAIGFGNRQHGVGSAHWVAPMSCMQDMRVILEPHLDPVNDISDSPRYIYDSVLAEPVSMQDSLPRRDRYRAHGGTYAVHA